MAITKLNLTNLRAACVKIISPMVDVVEHATVIAINIHFMADHWYSGIVLCVIIAYVCIYPVIRRT